MELSERKKIILSAIVEQYIRTGEPVGSKSLLTVLPMSLSSATVRNEMADLADMGYLEQPHTSAGRIPSHKGYRYYVDNLIDQSALDEVQKKQIEACVLAKSKDPDKIVEHASEVLADITNCAALSTAPTATGSTVTRIELVPIGRRTAMLVLLTSKGIIKSRVCRADGDITAEIAEKFYNITSASLIGRFLDEISLATMQTLAASVSEDMLTMFSLLAAVSELALEASKSDVILEGQSNLLNHRELENNTYELMEFLHKGDAIKSLLKSGDKDLSVLIGREAQYKQLENSSLILSKYTINGNDGGIIGVVGPTRIDYAKLIPSVKYLTEIVGKLLTQALEE
ncbi:MAG: heat-inducible transcriptional repressor HrcA [Clostridiales bacterium]|nr:heat-inducible transcriptional repressor HrcA [Clostridiales bacterium]